MTKPIYDSGSFRDPGGKIFYYDNEIFRLVTKLGHSRLKFLNSKNLINELIEKEYLIKTEEVKDSKLLSFFNNNAILKHERIDFISYPYEWTFNQLKDAALFHLDFQIYLLNKNCKLIDSSAFNVQFHKNKPIFIDVLSIEEYKDGEYWFGYKQFCENFLNPLLLKAKKGVDFNNWFKGNLEGISTEDLCNILSFKDFFSFVILIHIFLQNKLNIKERKKKVGLETNIKSLKKLSKNSYRAILFQLRNFIKSLLPKKQITSWEDYSVTNTYNKEEEEKKLIITHKFYESHKIGSLADLGCNDGKYSKYACSKNIKVVGFDSDLNVLDQLYLNSKKNNLNFLPIYSDFVNPSTDLGWNNNERKSLTKRANFDASISLAVIHHLAIAKNIPLDQAIKWLVSFSPIGLIEFVPKEDPTTKAMLALKGDIFPDYNVNEFEKILSSLKEIKNKNIITKTNRIIYEFANK